MAIITLIGAQKDLQNLDSFAKKFFTTIGVVNCEERESSNYIGGYYFKGKCASGSIRGGG